MENKIIVIGCKIIFWIVAGIPALTLYGVFRIKEKIASAKQKFSLPKDNYITIAN